MFFTLKRVISEDRAEVEALIKAGVISAYSGTSSVNRGRKTTPKIRDGVFNEDQLYAYDYITTVRNSTSNTISVSADDDDDDDDSIPVRPIVKRGRRSTAAQSQADQDVASEVLEEKVQLENLSFSYSHVPYSSRRNIKAESDLPLTKAVQVFNFVIFLDDTKEAALNRLQNRTSSGDGSWRRHNTKKVVIINPVLEGLDFNKEKASLPEYQNIFDKVTTEKDVITATNMPIKLYRLTDDLIIVKCKTEERGVEGIRKLAEQLLMNVPTSANEFFSNWNSQIMERIVKERDSALETMESLRKKLIHAQQMYGHLSMIANAANTAAVDVLSKQFERVEKLPQVKSLSFVGNTIKIETDDIWTDQISVNNEPPIRYYVGQFSIIFDVKTQALLICNFAAPNKEKYIPHGGNGNTGNSPCVGSFDDAFGSALQRFDYAQFFHTVLAYLMHVNPYDAGAKRSIMEGMFPKTKPEDRKLIRNTKYLNIAINTGKLSEYDPDEDDDD